MAYAQGTTVPVSRSKAEVESILRKAGATGYMCGWDSERGYTRVQCKLGGRMLLFEVWEPSVVEMKVTEAGRKRNLTAAKQAAVKETRRRWRGLVLIIKAKLEFIETGASSIDAEFLANLMLPDGSTVGSHAMPGVQRAYETGKMPKLLPGE